MDFQVYTAGEVKIWVQELGPGARWSSVNRGPLSAMQRLAIRGAPYAPLLRDILTEDMVVGARILTRLQNLYDNDDAFRRDLIAELNRRNALPLRSLPRPSSNEGNVMPTTIAGAGAAGAAASPTTTTVAVDGNSSLPLAGDAGQSVEGLRWAALLAAADSLQSGIDRIAEPIRDGPNVANEQ